MVSPLTSPPVATKPRIGRRASRWLILFSVPLLLLSMLLMSMQTWSIAQAATEFQVGNCDGTGDYPTIQQAVSAAVTATTINICPGTYSESVNLSLMASIGDITLRRVPGQTSAVLINPLVGPSLWITRQATFTGSITLEDIEVEAATDTGIDFGTSYANPDPPYDYYSGGTIGGNLLIRNIAANGNGGYGAYANVRGTTTVVDSSFNDNQAIGFSLYGENNVEFIDTEALRNGDPLQIGYSGTGIEVQAYQYIVCDVNVAATESHILFENVTANNNSGGGIELETDYDTLITNTVVISNAYDGIAAATHYGCGAEESGTLVVNNSVAEENGWYYDIDSVDAAVIPSFEGYGGFRLSSEGTVIVDGETTASANGSYGFCLYAYDTNVGNALAYNNGGDGFVYNDECQYFGKKSVRSANAEVAAASEPTIDIAEIGYTSFVISNSSAISNAGIGFAVSDDYTNITITKVSATENFTGVAFSSPQQLMRLTALGEVGVAGGVDVGTTTVLKDSLIQKNEVVGVYYGQSVEYHITVPSGGITSTNSLNSNIICENGTGLIAEQFEPNYNIGSLAYADSYVLQVDARGNWWGDISGPFNAIDNPSGTGNGVESTTYEPLTNTVDLQFKPFINTINGSASPNVTLVGLPVGVEYQFNDDTLAYYLENGVGDPNNGPLFQLTTDNGTLAGNSGKFIVNTLIADTATPSATGVMNVQLDGPCGLDSTIAVPVASPSIAVLKSPDAQGVASGDTAVFTITVINTGDITLTNISVADPVAPNCGYALGSFDDLGVGASSTYTCTLENVTTNIVNTVTAQGFASIDNGPAGNAVSDSDSVNVYVASFNLKKTVYVDGYNELTAPNTFNPSDCALASQITVPAGTAVKYCYTIENTGDYTLSTHSLIDSDFPNAILSNFPEEVGPGEFFSSVDAGVQVTKTLTVSTTNVATWTAEIAAPISNFDTEATAASIPVVGNAEATVRISSSTEDQDGDGIFDVDEPGDTNINGVPDFLEVTGPTNEQPVEQPNQLPGSLFLPSLGNND